MINTITITNPLGESIVLTLRSPESSGLFIRGIQGLGPVKADINTTESLSLDGSMFNSARAKERNIVFDLGFLEKPTIEDARQLTYKYFPLKKQIKIVVATDNRTVQTFGYVESNEPNIFSKQEATTISVICPTAFWYTESNTVIDFSNVINMFEFPFSNESLTDNLLEFSQIVIDAQKNIVYSGESPVGMILYIHMLGPVDDFIIYNVLTRQYMKLNSSVIIAMTGSGLDVGDDVMISTIKGNKSVYLFRNGEGINILNALDPASTWLELIPGDNTFYYTADSGIENAQFRIEYQTLYEGI